MHINYNMARQILSNLICLYFDSNSSNNYRILSFESKNTTSSNSPHLEAHAGFSRLLMKGIFDPYVVSF